MKRLRESIRIEIKCPYIYLNDIKQILEIFNENKINDEVIISSNGYVYDNLTELVENNKIINNLEIKSYRPYISIDFSKNGSYIYSNENDTFSRGVISQIFDLLKKRQRKFLSFIEKFYFIPVVLFPTSTLIAGLFLKKDNLMYLISIVLYSVGFIFLIWLIASNIIGNKYYSTINLSEISKASNFFTRNRDAIIINFIIGLLLFVFGIIVDRFLLR
ncbi:MAG: hypothetical protein WC549_05445 [Actinomycetota bacterium]